MKGFKSMFSKEKFVEQLKKGKSPSQIAKEYGVSRQYVSQCMHEYGISSSHKFYVDGKLISISE